MRNAVVLSSILAAVSFGCVQAGAAEGAVLLDFESPLPSGLSAISFTQGTNVPGSARVTDQYLSTGVRVSGAALVALGLGHAASGVNGIAGVNIHNEVDYGVPVSFDLFSPKDNATLGTLHTEIDDSKRVVLYWSSETTGASKQLQHSVSG